AVFETAQTLDNDGNHFFSAHIPHNSAHGTILCESAPARGKGRCLIEQSRSVSDCSIAPSGLQGEFLGFGRSVSNAGLITIAPRARVNGTSQHFAPREATAPPEPAHFLHAIERSLDFFLLLV